MGDACAVCGKSGGTEDVVDDGRRHDDGNGNGDGNGEILHHLC